VGKCIIAVEDILEAARAGRKTIAAASAECIVTPGARDKAAELGITIADGAEAAPAASVPSSAGGAVSPSTEVLVQEVCRLLKDRMPAGGKAADLEALVRSAVAARLSGAARPAAAVSGPASPAPADGVCLVSGQRLQAGEGGSPPLPVPEAAIVADAVRCGMESNLAAGYMEWQKAAFTRTVEFPEVAVVLEGELHLAVGGRTLVARPGDMLYFRKGVQVGYTAPARVKIACVNCTKD
jgi:ethanolamine utilization protein EutQ